MHSKAKFLGRSAALGVTGLFMTAAPVLAQTDSGSAGDAAAGIFGIGIAGAWMCCWGVMALLFLGLFVLWIWMLIDCIQRTDDRFPNPSENTKILWIVLLIVIGWIAAVAYYFMVYRAVPKTS